MTYADVFVGGIAIGLGVVALMIACGRWAAPYQLRTIRAIEQRFGKPLARGAWAAVAVAALMAGVAIVSGIRPSYAGQSAAENSQP